MKNSQKIFVNYKGYFRNFHEEKLKKLIDQLFMLNFGRIYDYEKQRKKQEKWRKIRKSLEKIRY